MSYYRSHHGTDMRWWGIIICLALALLILFGYNACTAQEWNDGICLKCNVRYELRGVYRGTYYYSCPKCGNEIARFGGR